MPEKQWTTGPQDQTPETKVVSDESSSPRGPTYAKSMNAPSALGKKILWTLIWLLVVLALTAGLVFFFAPEAFIQKIIEMI